MEIVSVFSKTYQKLSPSEIRILTELALLPERFKYNRFSALARKTMIKNFKEYYGWKVSPSNLNSKIYSIVDKNFIWRDEDSVLYVKKWLLDSIDKFLESNATKVEANFELLEDKQEE